MMSFTGEKRKEMQNVYGFCKRMENLPDFCERYGISTKEADSPLSSRRRFVIIKLYSIVSV